MQTKFQYMYILLPTNNIKIIIIERDKSNYVYLYNNNFFFILKNHKTSTIFLSNDKTHIEIHNQTNMKNYKTIENLLNNLLQSWEFYFFKKIKFTGKMYQLKKSKSINILKLNFGYSHKTIFNYKHLINIKKKKKVIFLFKNLSYLIKTTILFRNTRKINIFTKRGLRLSRQLVLKKTGKKSNY